MTHSTLTTWLWRHLHKYNAFLINNGLLEKKLDCSVDWIVKKCKNSFEFHSKLFIVNKHGLNNKTIKLIVKCYFVKS